MLLLLLPIQTDCHVLYDEHVPDNLADLRYGEELVEQDYTFVGFPIPLVAHLGQSFDAAFEGLPQRFLVQVLARLIKSLNELRDSDAHLFFLLACMFLECGFSL